MAKYTLHSFLRIANDFVPETFGRLTTVGPIFRLGKKSVVVCSCICGNVPIKCIHDLRRGTLSCGCLAAELSSQRATVNSRRHGGSKLPEYAIWDAMRQRCSNPKTRQYSDYGGRGITVFPDWDCKGGFAAWFAHIGPRPSKDHSIDRFPNPNGNYEPGNVRWATRIEQQNNTNKNRFLSLGDETKTVAEWARTLGCSPQTLASRLRSGWSVVDVLTTPIKHRKKCP